MADRISSENLKAVIDSINPNDVKVLEWNGLQIEIKPTLTIEEVSSFVQYVTEINFANEGDSYSPELGEFAFDYATISFYTNIDLPESVEEQYDIISRSKDLVNFITEHINTIQYLDIYEAIKDRVSARRDSDVTTMRASISQLFESLESLENSFGDIFSGLTGDDMTNLLGAIMNGGLDEEKLMDAYLNKRMKG